MNLLQDMFASPFIASRFPSPRPSPSGRESPVILTRFAPMNLKPDPSPRPSPLRKGRGGIIGR
ncbi:MAG: hypothetical protein NTW03_03590, partial [Verrucomicrobia bacterium]|nr:hypothetical protein [Verrucomicrobiota bacterium]